MSDQGMESDDSGVDSNVSQEVETVESLRAKLEAANNEAAKYRKQKNDAIKERDTYKKTKETDETKNWETLYKQAQEDRVKALDTVKKQAVNLAVKEALLKEKILPDAIKDATKLVDTSMISWDADDGVDEFSVESAVKVLRQTSKYLFETKIPATGNPANPRSGSANKTNEMTRAQWEAIKNPAEKAQAARKFTITD